MTRASSASVGSTPGSNSQSRSRRCAPIRSIAPPAFVTCGREFGRRLMQRHHVGAAAVAVGLDKPQLGVAHRGLNLGASDTGAASPTATAKKSNASRKWMLESHSVSSASKTRFRDSAGENDIYLQRTGARFGGQMGRGDACAR